MRRVIEAHNIVNYHNITRTFGCSRCNIRFESDEYVVEEHDGKMVHFDYCPVCDVGNFVKEEESNVRQDTS